MKFKSKASLLQEANQSQLYHKDTKIFQITMTFQEIMREYAYAFPPAQLVVLLFIMDRTVGWGKRWERISQRQFLQGIPNPDELALPYAGKLKMSLNTLKNALSRLIDEEVIVAQKSKGKNGTGTFYALNEKYFEHLPDEDEPKKTKASKIAD